jgi:hypothetical protein
MGQVTAPVPREPTGARHALVLAREGLRRSKVALQRGVPDADRAPVVADAVARARLLLSDARLEERLAPMPSHLDFTPPDPYSPRSTQRRDGARLARSTERFTRWLDERVQTRPFLDEDRALFREGRGEVAMLAAFRVGLWFEAFAAELWVAPVPRSPRPPEGIDEAEFQRNFDAWPCGDPMGDRTEPLWRKATDAYLACFERARRAGLAGPVLDECERALNRIRPQEFPIAGEVLPHAGYVSLVSDPVPLLRAL